jgi:hypothetical protein
MKGETRRIYMALFSFYKSTIIPMIWWSFVHADFLSKLENLLGLVGVNGTRVLERIEAPELPVDESFMSPETVDRPTRPGIPTRRRAPVPGPTSRSVLLLISRKSEELALSVVMTMRGRDCLNFRSDDQMVNLIF